MADLKSWQELPAGGAVRPDPAFRPRTGSWRTGLKPEVDRSACVNCLLCWLYCPDSAVLVDGEVFVGFDYDYCKGCEVCAEMCPAGAITMVPEDGHGD
jgi:2-oxoacid:acceptor oxidoreductase delta subunit (pyruvate/2-ketoisovalerate family)